MCSSRSKQQIAACSRSVWFIEHMPLDGAAPHVATQHHTLQRSTTRCNAAPHVATHHALQRSTTCCNAVQHVFVQPIEVRFIEYMPFDDNKWAERKLVPYAEMLAERRPLAPLAVRRTVCTSAQRGGCGDCAVGSRVQPYSLRGVSIAPCVRNRVTVRALRAIALPAAALIGPALCRS